MKTQPFDYEAAWQTLQKHLEVDPKGVIKEALSLLERKDVTPLQRGELLFFIGDRYLNERPYEPKKAMHFYKESLKYPQDDDERFSCYVQIASCYSHVDKYKRALCYLERAKGLYKKNEIDREIVTQFLWEFGRCSFHSGKWSQALSYYEQLIQHIGEPKDEHEAGYLDSAFYSRATCLRELGRVKESIDQLDDIIRDTRLSLHNHLDAHLALAHTYYDLKDRKNAIFHYETVFDSKETSEDFRRKSLPYLPHCYGWLGKEELEKGNYQSAKDYHQKALDLVESPRDKRQLQRIIAHCQKMMGKDAS